MCSLAQSVHVRSEDGNDSLSLHFQLNGKNYHLLRSKQEPVSKALKRIMTTISRGDKPKKKDRAGSANLPNHISVVAQVYASGLESNVEVCPDTLNQDAWINGHTFTVNDTRFNIIVNPPTVKHLQLPGCIITMCPAVPMVELEFTDVEKCDWVWRRCGSSIMLPTVFPEVECSNSAERQSIPLDYQEQLSTCPILSTSFVYWPTDDDNGHNLILECTPCNERKEQGQTVVVASKNMVSRFHNLPMIERHLFTPNYLEDSNQFRVISYNILANVYATSEHAKERLYPYCDASALDQDYRQCLLSREVLGYRGDIICLQEVGTKYFSQFLCPVLNQWNYEGCFHEKAGKTPEGEAIFFNRSRFSLMSEEAIVFREFVQECHKCRDILSLHPLILNNLLKRHNILQTVLLRSIECPSRYLMVANTHFYFHPMGDHIRLLQVAISLRYLENRLQSIKKTIGKDAHVAVVFCGDFNSCPCTAAYNYMVNSIIGRNHPDWQLFYKTEIQPCSCNHRVLNVIHEYDDDDGGGHWIESSAEMSSQQSTVGLDLRHIFNFSNSCGTRHATNITLGWTGVIDYIFIDSDWLSTQRVMPFPPAEHLTEHVALPSINFPSDHIALVTDLTWKTLQQQ